MGALRAGLMGPALDPLETLPGRRGANPTTAALCADRRQAASGDSGRGWAASGSRRTSGPPLRRRPRCDGAGTAPPLGK